MFPFWFELSAIEVLQLGSVFAAVLTWFLLGLGRTAGT